MNGTLVETGPKMDWTRDNKIYDRYLLWKDKVENYFCSILADATPQQKTGYLRLWMGDEGVPLIKKWVSTGKIDFSDPVGRPASGAKSKSSSFKRVHSTNILGSSRNRIETQG